MKSREQLWILALVLFLLMLILIEQYQVGSKLTSIDLKMEEGKKDQNDHLTYLRSTVSKLSSNSPVKPTAPPITQDLSPNYAPHLKVYPEACKSNELWGREHHGGWYICKDTIPPKNCIVYSFGLGADWSFDTAAENNNCEVHGFDPTNLLWKQGMHGREYSGFDYAKQYPSKLKKFHNWGIGGVSTTFPPGTIPQGWPGLGDPPLSKSNPEPWLIKSLQQTIQDLGHNRSKITILKVDIEGGEWSTLMAAFSSKAMLDYLKKGMISQLLLEFHWDPNNRGPNGRYRDVLVKIEELGFLPWKVERHEGSDCCLDISYVWKDKSKI